MVITDGVESGWRCVEEVDQIGDDGVGAFFLRHVFRIHVRGVSVLELFH